MGKCCCKGCEKRTMTCHNTCEDYIDYREAMRKKRKIEWEKRMEDSKVRDHIFETKRKNEKKSKR